MSELIFSVLSALGSFLLTYYFAAKKFRNEKVWEIRTRFYSRINSSLLNIQASLDKAQFSGGVFAEDDFDDIPPEISNIEGALSEGEFFIDKRVSEQTINLVRSLREGMYWYRDFLHDDGGPSDSLTFMRNKVAEAKVVLLECGRHEMGNTSPWTS